MAKNLPAMQQTWVQTLGREDTLEKEMATHSRILAWRIPVDRGAWWATVHRVAKSWTQLSSFVFSRTVCCILRHDPDLVCLWYGRAQVCKFKMQGENMS